MSFTPAILPLLTVDASQHHADNAQDHGRNPCAIVVTQHQHNADTGKADGIIKMHIHNNHPVKNTGTADAAPVQFA